jgi:hypothetical protein
MATQYILGRHLYSCTVTPGTRADADGAISWGGSPVNILAYVESISITDVREVERITPVNAAYAHYERTLLDSTCEIVEILRKGAAPVLPLLLQNYDLIKLVAVRGKQAGSSGGGILGTYTYIGQIARGSDGHVNMGKNTASISLVPFYDGTTAPLVYGEA